MIADEIIKHIEQFNPINIITDSKARGSKKQLAQLVGNARPYVRPVWRHH